MPFGPDDIDPNSEKSKKTPKKGKSPKSVNHTRNGKPIDPGDFEIPPSFSKGKSSRIFASIPEPIRRQIDEIVASRNFPYLTDADLIRHAVVEHLRWLESLDGKPIRSVMTQLRLVQIATAEYLLKLQIEKSFEELTRVLTTAIASSDHDGARKLLADVIDFVKDMPPGPKRHGYADELAARFGTWCEDNKALKLLVGIRG